MVQDEPRKSTKSKTAPPVQKIRLSDVSVVRDGRAILEHVTLELNAGKRYLLVGKNGCGKSTLLKTINRNITPDTGIDPGFVDIKSAAVIFKNFKRQ